MSKPQPAKTPIEILLNTDYERISPIEQHLKFVKKQSDPRFGDILVYQHAKSKNYYFARENIASSQSQAAEYIVKARKKMFHHHPHVHGIIDYSVTYQKELCSSFYVVKYFYEYPHTDAYRENTERIKSNRFYTHYELIHYVYQNLLALQFLESTGRFHGDIRPIHVTLSKVEILSKLVDKSDDIFSLDRQKQVQSSHLIKKDPIYQSELLYQNLMKNNLKFEVNSNKEDLFALGLVILEMGNLTSIQNIYNQKDLGINDEALDIHFNAFKQKYLQQNLLLTSTLQELLKIEEPSRLTATDLLNKMPKYDVVITYLKSQGQIETANSQPNNIFSLPDRSPVHSRSPSPSNYNNSGPISRSDYKIDIDRRCMRENLSIERPIVIPSRNDSKSVIFVNSVIPRNPSNSFIERTHYERTENKSIENPGRVLYLAQNNDVKLIENSFNDEYNRYIKTQNEVIVKRTVNRYTTPEILKIDDKKDSIVDLHDKAKDGNKNKKNKKDSINDHSKSPHHDTMAESKDKKQKKEKHGSALSTDDKMDPNKRSSIAKNKKPIDGPDGSKHHENQDSDEKRIKHGFPDRNYLPNNRKEEVEEPHYDDHRGNKKGSIIEKGEKYKNHNLEDDKNSYKKTVQENGQNEEKKKIKTEIYDNHKKHSALDDAHSNSKRTYLLNGQKDLEFNSNEHSDSNDKQDLTIKFTEKSKKSDSNEFYKTPYLVDDHLTSKKISQANELRDRQSSSDVRELPKKFSRPEVNEPYQKVILTDIRDFDKDRLSEQHKEVPKKNSIMDQKELPKRDSKLDYKEVPKKNSLMDQKEVSKKSSNADPKEAIKKNSLVDPNRKSSRQGSNPLINEFKR
jgi:hypothetical protein